MSNLDSGFFLPLKGHENNLRLAAKFEHYFDSDNDDDDNDKQTTAVKESIGKISQWKPSPQGQWLQSPSKLRRKCVVASGGNVKYVSPKSKKRVKESPAIEASGKDEQASSSRERPNNFLAKPSPEQKIKMEIHEYSSEDEKEWNQSISNKGKGTGTNTLVNTSNPISKTPISCQTTSSVQVGERIFSVWHEFSEADGERPKLPIEPVSPKLDFLLSEDDAQPRVAVPALVNQYLRDYQREGIQFLFGHYMNGKGAILGDDMGLGKTVQVIGFLAALLGKTGNRTDSLHALPKFIKQMSNDFPDTPPKRATRPFLIIGPTAVLYNWLDELNTWGYFTFGKFHGPDKDTCLADLKKGKLEIVITTFETYRDNVEQLNQIDWEAVFVDEAHKIKGLKAQVTQALRIIKTPCRYGLTGTALQNNMTELWSLLDWAQPKVLGSLEQFETGYVRAIEMGQRHDATKRELAHARKQRDKFASIRKKMLLRRTKKLIAHQLPNKEELVVMCRLSDLQVSVYKSILDHPDMQLVLQAENPCDCDSGKQRASCCYKRRPDGTKVWGLVFSFMHLMLKAANHVGLLIPESNRDTNNAVSLCDCDDTDDLAGKEKPGAALARSVFLTAFKEQPQFVELTRSAAFRTLSDPRYCGKMKILQGLLQVFEKNHDKVLVFSYSTKLLDIIEHYIISKGHEYSRIDGKVSGQKRRDIVLKFNTDPNLFICLISTKAGGLGLNLTGANKVVIFDPNWNPSHDLQAQDRAYRIGQTRDVKVFRLVSAGTIEENIYLRQIYKQQLDEVAIGNINARRYFRGVQGDKSNQGELFGVKNMFALRTGNVCLTMDILKRNERLEKGLAGYDITNYVPPKKERKSSGDGFDDDDDEEEASSVESCPEDDKADKEEEEEDENFLRDIFGLDHTELKPSSSTLKPTKLAYQEGQPLETVSEYSDSDDEFSLIPVTRGRHRQKKQSSAIEDSTVDSSYFSNNAVSPGKRAGSELGENTSASGALDDLFDMSDITFSTTRKSAMQSGMSKLSKPDTCVESSEVKVEEWHSTSKRSRLSWLFPDSEHESDNEDYGRGAYRNDKEHIQIDRGKKALGSVTPRKDLTAKGSKKRVQVLSSHKSSRPRAKATSALANRTFSSEQSFLAGSDILHTHTNRGVLGTSRAEDHMTRCAIKDVFELNTNTQAPALACEPLSQSEDEEDNVEQTKGKSARKKKKASSQGSLEENYDRRQSIKAGPHRLLIGQTPPTIARRQFSELARSKGMSEQDFAHYVSHVSVSCRLEMLKNFYTQKHPNDAVVEVVTKIYSKTSTAATKAKKNPITPVRNQIQEHALEETSKSAQQSHSRSSTKHTSASSTGKRGGKLSPGKSRSSRAPTPFFLEASTLASDSQESVTAKSPAHPERDDEAAADSDSSSPGYQPVSPPPKRRLSPFLNKASPLKSQHRTRLRHKVEVTQKGENSSVQQEYQEMATSLGHDLPHDTFVDHPDADMLKPKSQFCEDIPSLLHEMCQPCPENFTDPGKSPVPSKNYTYAGIKSKGSKEQQSHDAGKTPEAKNYTTPISRRKPVSVLDDIFGGSSPPSLEEDMRSNSDVKSVGASKHTTLHEKRNVKGVLERAITREDKREHSMAVSKSMNLSERKTDKNSAVLGGDKSSNLKEKYVSKNAFKDAEQTSSRSNSNKIQGRPGTSADIFDDPAVSKDEEECDSEMFDVLMTSSTFKEGAHPCYSDKSTKTARKQKGNKNTSMKSSTSKRHFIENEKSEEDFDDLENWGNFTRKKHVPVESESLFS